jgi:hypothetical protein
MLDITRTLSWPMAAVTLAACGLIAARANAGTTVYKCVTNGQTTLTDKPCPGEKANELTQPMTVVSSSQKPWPVGKWSGQLQFQETANGQAVQAAHSVAPALVEFTADGKVSGTSAENGCQFLGIWHTSMETLVHIDLTLSHCQVDELNRRYIGMSILAKPDVSVQFSVNSVPGMLSKDVGKYFDIKGTLRR